MEKSDLISPDRAALQSIGVRGEILETPGHSDDRISLLLDSGVAFIGDLTSPDLAGEEHAERVREVGRDHGARRAGLLPQPHRTVPGGKNPKNARWAKGFSD